MAEIQYEVKFERLDDVTEHFCATSGWASAGRRPSTIDLYFVQEIAGVPQRALVLGMLANIARHLIMQVDPSGMQLEQKAAAQAALNFDLSIGEVSRQVDLAGVPTKYEWSNLARMAFDHVDAEVEFYWKSPNLWHQMGHFVRAGQDTVTIERAMIRAVKPLIGVRMQQPEFSMFLNSATQVLLDVEQQK